MRNKISLFINLKSKGLSAACRCKDLLLNGTNERALGAGNGSTDGIDNV